jgi:hypothetical protein
MKKVVSVSLGSKSRDYAVVIELLGQKISIERIGTNGDTRKAKELYEELDGKVDCLGVGGAVLAFDALDRSYKFPAVYKLVENVTETPFVDGSGFKNIVERRIAKFILDEIGDEIESKRALITSAVDRLALAKSFVEEGFEVMMGDLMFALGIPIPLHSLKSLNRVAHVIGPVLRFLPMSAVYPSGEEEDENTPRFEKWFRWAQVIGGDGNYITRYMPLDMRGKIIATNTTTARDVALFRERGVSYLVTSTPRLGTRSFGTNLMESVLVALAGKGRALEPDEVEELLDALGWGPNLEKLN